MPEPTPNPAGDGELDRAAGSGRRDAHILSGLFSDEHAQPFLDLYRSADQVIAVARYFSSGLEKRSGITGVRHVPNAVDLDAFAPRAPSAALRADFGIDERTAAVLLSGTLITRKRPMDLLKAAERVLECDRSVVFLLAGVGVMRDELMGFCRERGIADGVRFLGWVPHERMPELYGAADLVVMTSEAEGVSRACIEALACGRTLLASNIPAARELIEDGQNGFLFPTGDHHALAKSILALLKDDRLRADVGRKARESVRGRRPERAVAMYVEELQALVRRPN